jgi:triacylglycerol lipase
MSEAASPAFNAANPDVPGVYYQSWAGVASVSGRVSSSQMAAVRAACDGKTSMIAAGTFDKIRLEYALFDLIIGPAPHDGMEDVASSRWGDWKGCIPADHADELGRMTTDRPNPRTGFDPQRFWRQVVGDLAASGF